jgi:hypothetical protein
MTRTKLYLSFTTNVIVTLDSCKRTTTKSNSKESLERSKADRIETDKYIDAGSYFQN